MIFEVVEHVKDFMLWLEKIIGSRARLLYAEIFDLNLSGIIFSGRTILSTAMEMRATENKNTKNFMHHLFFTPILNFYPL